MMIRLLDTCVCVFLIRQKQPGMLASFAAFEPGDLGISSVTESELRYGAEKSAAPGKNHHQLDHFLLSFPVLPYGSACARHYGEIRRHLEKSGTPIGSMDLLIAAHARAEKLTLVTHNTREFARVPGLLIEDWADPLGDP
jgi:tRNA(fMet)-specific endonuclease VapC